jgi:transcriptional regulator with XRE-family HTH domain
MLKAKTKEFVLAIRSIKDERIRRGMSLRELGRMTGLSATFLSGLERGLYKRPGWRSLYLIANILGLEYMKLLKSFGHDKTPT